VKNKKSQGCMKLQQKVLNLAKHKSTQKLLTYKELQKIAMIMFDNETVRLFDDNYSIAVSMRRKTKKKGLRKKKKKKKEEERYLNLMMKPPLIEEVPQTRIVLHFEQIENFFETKIE